MIVLLSVAASIGIFGFADVPATLIIFEIIPFKEELRTLSKFVLSDPVVFELFDREICQKLCGKLSHFREENTTKLSAVNRRKSLRHCRFQNCTKVD